jgi:hypothetical protein
VRQGRTPLAEVDQRSGLTAVRRARIGRSRDDRLAICEALLEHELRAVQQDRDAVGPQPELLGDLDVRQLVELADDALLG